MKLKEAWKAVVWATADKTTRSQRDQLRVAKEAIEILEAKLASREEALRVARGLLYGIEGHWFTDENKLIQIGILIDVELGE